MIVYRPDLYTIELGDWMHMIVTEWAIIYSLVDTPIEPIYHLVNDFNIGVGVSP